MSGDFQQLPDSRRMESHLVDASWRVLKREPSPYSTTFPCEVVTCQKPGDQTTELFCKYSAGIDYTGFGHRGVSLELHSGAMDRSADLLFRSHVWDGHDNGPQDCDQRNQNEQCRCGNRA